MRSLRTLLGIVCTGLMAVSAASAQDGQIVVTRMEGAAMIVRDGQQLPAAVGMPCSESDTLLTPDGCTLDVSVNGKAGCRVLPGTEVGLTSAGADMKLSVAKGNVILNLDKLNEGSTFQIETPTAIASVRGTQFWGRVDTAATGDPVTTFAVREGAVEVLVKSAGQSFRLEQGQALDIPLSGALPSVRPALAGELQAMEQASSIATAA
ncbi:MAG: hypothetical protein MOGMAGMI_00209 [Candidatus Omnitrophica bacterium]|nr:hypothetical protein [Candidatus Omnitrophota bacterium]